MFSYKVRMCFLESDLLTITHPASGQMHDGKYLQTDYQGLLS